MNPYPITASFADGVIITLNSFKPEYKAKYFNADNFKRSSKAMADRAIKAVESTATRRKIKNLYISITIRCDGLEGIFPYHIHEKKPVPLPPVA